MNAILTELKNEIEECRFKNLPISNETKEKTVSLLSHEISARRLATMVGLHPSTVAKWSKRHRDYIDVDTSSEINDQDFLAREPIENTQKNVVVTPSTPIFFLSTLFVALILCEYYLLSQAYLFHKIILQESHFALIKSILTEVVPVMLTIIIFVFKTSLVEKAIIHVCLIASFLFSAYTAGAYALNNQSDEAKMERDLLNTHANLKEQL